MWTTVHMALHLFHLVNKCYDSRDAVSWVHPLPEQARWRPVRRSPPGDSRCPPAHRTPPRSDPITCLTLERLNRQFLGNL